MRKALWVERGRSRPHYTEIVLDSAGDYLNGLRGSPHLWHRPSRMFADQGLRRVRLTSGVSAVAMPRGFDPIHLSA
jgi:hypothetical protein